LSAARASPTLQLSRWFPRSTATCMRQARLPFLPAPLSHPNPRHTRHSPRSQPTRTSQSPRKCFLILDPRLPYHQLLRLLTVRSLRTNCHRLLPSSWTPPSTPCLTITTGTTHTLQTWPKSPTFNTNTWLLPFEPGKLVLHLYAI